ncbi:MAG TPA: superoxide dismutase [Patescibacteria group bacterium]|nr:superoxide dismutase [Patescibacteria group bacterium]
MEKEIYSLPPLPYGLSDLEPFISEKQLRIHYEKHHQSYIGAANSILQRMSKAKDEKTKLNMNAVVQDLTFNVAGHILHSLFWSSLSSPEAGGTGPEGILAEAIDRDFGSLERFKDEFGRMALGLQGSGWVALTYEHLIGRLLLTQIGNHQDNLYPTLPIIVVLDVWEHAYYLDYESARGRYVDNWWQIVNWRGAGERFESLSV